MRSSEPTHRGVAVLLIAAFAWLSGLAFGADAPAPRADPDPKLTPGAVLPVDARTVCQPGYAKSARAVSALVKREAWQRYGYPGPQPGDWEIDHFIPLELGGSNDVTNLWPQPAEPEPGYRAKDWVEGALHALVCARPVPLLTLAEAQERMRSWLAIWMILHRETGPAHQFGSFSRRSGP